MAPCSRHILPPMTRSSWFRVTFVIGGFGRADYCDKKRPNPLFCRGTRFEYTFYYPEPAPSEKPGIRLSRVTGPTSHPIHESISRLDHEAMDILTLPPSTAADAHDKFASYLAVTKNTICGRHPIGVLFGALASLEKDQEIHSTLKWVKYEQSSPCQSIRDSSVSYASAYIRF